VSAADPPPPSDLIGRGAAWVLDLPPVRWLKPILDDYGAAGGGLLATGVAFNSLFAILPAILLLVSLLGFFLADEVRRDDVIGALANQFPPLREFFHLAMAQLSSGAASLSIIGLVGLIWGSSRFYQSLDDAIARIFRGSRRRDPFRRGLRGVLSVGFLVGAVAAVLALVQVANSIPTATPVVSGVATIVSSTVGSLVGTVIVLSAAIAALYRLVPTETPSWTAIRRPALTVGIALTVLTAVFALLAPRLIGSLQVYGAFVTVFAAMIWLSYVAQVILIGAAWVFRRTVGAGSGESTVHAAPTKEPVTIGQTPPPDRP
jgi:YihY family inner membrane protein